jgi:hypothetical protein
MEFNPETQRNATRWSALQYKYSMLITSSRIESHWEASNKGPLDHEDCCI